jgi:hypothetical protein
MNLQLTSQALLLDLTLVTHHTTNSNVSLDCDLKIEEWQNQQPKIVSPLALRGAVIISSHSAGLEILWVCERDSQARRRRVTRVS